MFFSNESDAYNWCLENDYPYNPEYMDSGVLIRNERSSLDTDYILYLEGRAKTLKDEANKIYYVYCKTPSGLLYAKKKGYTYSIFEAEKVTQEKAQKKAEGMTQRSRCNYYWRVGH